MKPLTLKDIAQAVKGQLNNPSIADTTINGVSFDTREDMASKLFVALKGNTDGHDHIPTAIEKGAVCVFSQQSTPHNAIIVEDCKKALGDLAAYYRSLFDIKVIGITGSNGKTSTKDMVASVLSQRFNVLKTQGNYN
ncbi:MAG: Mur ligase family protein, partial [Defluviitaleaceae bacterium]|nr:Mur ligase family protein [Defluviitaleaceae bacterium]